MRFGPLNRIFILILFLIWMPLTQCKEEIFPSLGAPRTLENGILDLSFISPGSLEPFPLAGDWLAYPGELPETELEFLALENKVGVPLKIPGYWVNQGLPAHGFVTYKLKLKLDFPENLMIYLREASSAYRIFHLNKERGLVLLGEGGKVSKSADGSVGYYEETARTFRGTPSSVLYLQVSNYLYSRGGPYYSPILGSSQKTLVYLRFKERKKTFFLGFFAILVVSHFFLFVHRPKQRQALFFAMLCLCWLLRILLFERFSRDWFVPSDFMEMLQIRLEYLSFVGIMFFSLKFFFETYPIYLQQKFTRLLLIPVILSFVVTCVTPYSFYTKLLVFNQVYMAFILCVTIYAAIRGVTQKESRYEAGVILFGTGIVLLTTIYDSVVFFKRWDLPLLTDIGFSVFSLCLSIVISSQNSKAWETAEYLTLNLQKEVDWKTIELRKEKEKAEKSGELKDKFISIVSHDIRSPLFGISSVVNLLTESPPTLSPEKTKQVLGEASVGLKNILSMVEELIKYSRFQNAAVFPDYQLFDFHLLVQNLLEKAESQIQSKKIQLVSNIVESSVGIGDPNLIEHLIWNLMTNALKFTKEGGMIEISLLEQNRNWCLRIKDNGIGMPEYWSKHVLEEGFLYIRKGTRDEMGAGVGLAFCKEVAERHGAKLELISEDSKGTSVEFVLPNYEKIILVLDDNPGYRKQIRNILKDFEVIIWEEEFPEHALTSIGKLKPDLIIVDQSMPEKTGIEFLKELYSEEERMEIRSILVSSSHTNPSNGKKLEKEALEIGCDAFVTKTEPDEKLKKLVVEYLQL